MATSSDIIFYRYSPENMSKDILRKLFVGREKLLEDLVKEIGNAAKNKTPRFYLVVGPRGIGKSHFLTLLYYEINNKFPAWLIPVKLAEEEYSVYRASDLFLRIVEEYSKDTSDILSLEDEDEILHASVEKLKNISKSDEKQFVIFVENLHELFKQLEKEELHKLRSIFQKYDIFSVVATAPLIFPSLSGHDEPFYNFFNILHLNEFSYPEIRELMQRIAETENGEDFFEKFGQYEERIHGMVHLTGGSPRLVFLFYDMITGGEIENIENAFFKVIDEHTPFYQEVFQMLTGQQRRIFDVLISFGETATPKQISEKARIKLQTVNTQLRRLETDGYVISRPMGRHSKYEVRERLFRLWREMRQPFGRKRVSILLEFLQLWYTAEERKELFRIKFELLAAGEKSVLKELCYYAEIQPHEFKTEALLKLTPKLIELGERDEADYDIRKLKETAVKTNDKELECKILLYEGQLLYSENKYEDALKAFNKVLEMNSNDEFTLYIKGLALGNLGKYKEALDVFNMVLETNPKYEDALFFKGLALGNLGKYKEALDVFNMVLEINPKYEDALFFKGFALEYLGKYKKALDVFNMVLKINPRHEDALFNKGLALGNLGKYEEALDVFNMVLEINSKHEDALFNKGLAIEKLGNYKEALDVFNMVLEINSKHENSLFFKGLALGNLGNHKEALDVFNMVLEINPKYEDALFFKGFTLENLGKYKEALDVSNMVLEINPKHENALFSKGFALGNLGKYKEALDVFNMVLEINPKYEDALFFKGLALGNLGKYKEALDVSNMVLEINPKHENALFNKGFALGNLGKYKEALDVFNMVLEINPKHEGALRNKAVGLLKSEKYKEGLELAIKILYVVTEEHSKIDASLIVIEAYLGLDRKAEATLEVEKINDTIADQEPDLIEEFTEFCLILAREELKEGNRGSAAKFIKMAFENSSKLETDIVKESTINFLKAATDSGELQVIKAAAEEILNLQKDEFTGLIRPITKAIEIIETKDLNKYYDLQIEEREIVADIVKKITKSDELVPDEIKRKDSY